MFVDTIRQWLGRGGSAARPAGTEPAASGRTSSAPTGGASASGSSPDPLHLAACTLLFEVASADGAFDAAERAHLESVLERHFSLPPESGRRLLALAEEEHRRSIDHFQFTSLLQQSYDLGQKMVLAEVMWGLVLADGRVAEEEQYMTRKIANLLGLEPGYLSAAKAKASERREGSN